MTDDTLVPTEVAAQILGVAPATLRGWQGSGVGPRFVRQGTGHAARCYYRVADIQEWHALRAFNPCSPARMGGT
jgi:hypothetical protein